MSSLSATLLCLSIVGLSSAAIDWQGNWAFRCDYPGNDLKSFYISGEQCGGLCAAVTGCTAWSYKDGKCSLKKGVGAKDAKENGDGSQTCGYNGAPPASAPASTSGPMFKAKTTRYWDCCKPSCSWPGKAAGSPPVKTCAIDGVTKIDPVAKSGCEAGGSSFVCNDQKPWNISETLAYGFAAGHLAGMGEDKLCCACYKLDFTTGPVVGKSMIVQVTNTGDDLAENHFDLQIPGGGVGIFNGCRPQWNSPADGWGQKYGGVGSLNECDQLPWQIRDGCKFRFGWFKNADNPLMNLVRVRCPDAIIAKTGCRRADDPK